MPNWKVRYDAVRRYQASWSNDFPWVSKTLDGSENAYCSICNRTMKPKMSVLLSHSLSRGHVAKSREVQSIQQKVADDDENDDDVHDNSR